VARRPDPYAARERVQFVPWKPDVCAEPGCTERHPAYSRDGMDGPWRCKAHDATARRKEAQTTLL
jgi:hypothetical protein